MMGRGVGTRAAALGLVVALAFTGLVLGEVSIDTENGQTWVLVVGIIEDPDPIPQIWNPVRPVPPGLVLNPTGSERGDGRPDVDYDPTTGWPVVIWAYKAGADHDIAYTRWDGQTWSATRFLTGTTNDEVDPRVFVGSNGVAHVVWWAPGSPSEVYLASAPATATVWPAGERLDLPGAAGRRPSVAVWQGKLVLAYERNAGSSQEVVVAWENTGGAWLTNVVALAPQGQPLDPVLHTEAGRLWVDWKSASDRISFSRYQNESWTAPQPVSWSDPTWFGELAARDVVRELMLAP